jgi:hypothetical protein
VKDLVKRVNEVDLACPRDAKDEGVVVALDGVGQFLERVLRVSKKFPERFSRVDVSSDELMKKVDPSAAFWGDLSISNSQVVPSLEVEAHTLGGDAAAPEVVPAPGH